MSTSLSHLLQILVDEDQPLPLARIEELSDLDSKSTAELESIWDKIPTPKRRQLIREMGRLAQDQIELNFQSIYLLAMSDSDSVVRRDAIDKSWESEDPVLIRTFLTLLRDDPIDEVRTGAAAALGRFIYLGEVAELPDDIQQEMEDLLLTAISEDPSLDVRFRSLESMGFSSRDEVPMLIEEFFLEGGLESVQTALLAMGRSADNRWNDHVVSQLQSPEPMLRRYAVTAAGELAIREAVDDLIDLVDDVDESIREEAIWALAQTGGNKATKALDDLLSHVTDENERQLLEDAIDLLQFTEGTRNLFLLDFDVPDEENSN